MCGIAGIYCVKGSVRPEWIKKMAAISLIPLQGELLHKAKRTRHRTWQTYCHPMDNIS